MRLLQRERRLPSWCVAKAVRCDEREPLLACVFFVARTLVQPRFAGPTRSCVWHLAHAATLVVSQY